MKPFTETTSTLIVTEHLRRVNDFQTVKQIELATGRSNNRVCAALHHLRKYHVVDHMESDGQLWWYALPTAEDTRQKVCEERRPENKPRRRRKPRTTTDAT